MRRKVLYSFLLIISLFVFVFGIASCNNSSNNNDNNSQQTNKDKYYTITFKNDDGQILSSNSYKEGSMPSYSGTPSKVGESGCTYNFIGWVPSITPATKNCEYVATYESVKSKYTVTWKNWDGTVLEVDNVPYGSMPSYDGLTPNKPSAGAYNYIFNGWSPTIDTVTKNIDYYAQFTEETRMFTVTWKNWDGTVLEVDNVPYGSMPSYDGQTPERLGDSSHVYIFDGWSAQISYIFSDMTYTAKYQEKEKIILTEENCDEYISITKSCSRSGAEDVYGNGTIGYTIINYSGSVGLKKSSYYTYYVVLKYNIVFEVTYRNYRTNGTYSTSTGTVSTTFTVTTYESCYYNNEYYVGVYYYGTPKIVGLTLVEVSGYLVQK